MKIDTKLRYKSGIYQISNLLNGNIYIGSSVDIYNRLHTYLSLNKRGKVHNKHLQSAFNKYGISNFHTKVLEFVDISTLSKEQERILLRDCEQKWSDALKPQYNKRKHIDLNYQISPSKTTREKISESMKKAIKIGLHTIKRVQSNSLKMTLFNLEGDIIKRFDSCGLLAEFIGRKGECLTRYARKGHKLENYLIYFTKDENKVVSYSQLKKQKYERRSKRNETK